MNTRRALMLLLIWLCNSAMCHAQNNAAKPCSWPEGGQMDFWLGDWVITYADNSHAYSVVDKKMDGCVVHEQFRDPGKSYVSESWNVYNPNIHKWQQTRVDNQGAYLQMAGKLDGADMILYAKPKILQEGNLQMRAVYYNIKPESFDWKWESSRDNGNSWKAEIEMHYDRKK